MRNASGENTRLKGLGGVLGAHTARGLPRPAAAAATWNGDGRGPGAGDAPPPLPPRPLPDCGGGEGAEGSTEG
jgi:hypothetical protein